jgi:hypothetical protein
MGRLLWCGETAVSALRPWACCTIPWVSRRVRLGLSPNSFTRESFGAVGDGRRKWEFSLSIPVRFLVHAVKSYDMGLPAFIPIRKESVLQIFIALKNPLPWPGSNPQSLGPVASTLSTTPPSLLYNSFMGPFPGAQARPGCDADHSPPSSAEVENV